MAKTKKETQKSNYQFKAEITQLLDLIVHSLYKHPEIFLRELISNASDALNRVHFRQLTDKNVIEPKAELNINIEVDQKKQLFSIEDSGIGMTKEELVQNIGTVANSGTLKYLKELQAQGKQVDADMIGRFGVGFYSVFMVTDEVIIETRHADPRSKAYRWVSDGKSSFTVEEIERKKRGTKISFRLNDDYKEFADENRVRNTIQKYSNFVDFPILINGKKENVVQALWRKKESAIKDDELNEFYKFVSMDYEAPLGHIHLAIEGKVNFKALLFVPKKAPLNLFYEIEQSKGLHLYSQRVFIQDDAGEDLLPEYLRFIKGVVDTEDLPLNVSRESTQFSPVMAKIKNILTKKILTMLEDWAQNDPGKYENFYQNFGPLFKTGINTDYNNKERLLKLLRFESTATEKGSLTSLKDYVDRMNKDQKNILYISGESREVAAKNPNLEYFRKNDIEVLFFTDPVDVFILPNLDKYDKKSFQSIEKADVDIKDEKDEDKTEAIGKDALKSLIEVFKSTLGDKVADVATSRRLVDSPATLVVAQDGLDPQMERMMKMFNKGSVPQKKILEINPRHPLIKNLSRLNLGDSKDETLRKSIVQLYESAQLIEGNLSNPTEFVNRMNELLVKATS